MTAINIVCHKLHNCLHVVTDAAVYTADGIAPGFAAKVFTVPAWPGVLGVRGVAVGVAWLGQNLSGEFASFDDLLDGVENRIQSIVVACGLPTVELIIAGWSARRAAPEAYQIRTGSDLPLCTTADQADAGKYMPDPFRLQKLGNTVCGPRLDDHGHLLAAAGFEGVHDDGDPELVLWDLLKVIEVQRQATWSDGIHWVGGYAQATTVYPDRIEQRVLQRWPDKLGELINPEPIDWAQWHRDNPKPAAGVIELPSGSSRLKRQMAERKARKHNLEVVR